MNKVKKIFFGVISYILIMLNNVVYASSDLAVDIANFELIKYVLIIIGIVSVVLVLFISYKADQKQDDKEIDFEENKEDEEYDDIQTDEEQSLYSSFGKENSQPEGFFTSTFVQKEYDKEPVLSDEEEIVKEIPNDFEFDDILGGPIKNNILKDIQQKEPDEINEPKFVNEEVEEAEKIEEKIDLDEDFLNQMNENLANPEKFSIMNEIKEESIPDTKEEKDFEGLDNIFSTKPKEPLKNKITLVEESIDDENIKKFLNKNEDEDIKKKDEIKKKALKRVAKQENDEKQEEPKTVAKKTTRRTTKKTEDKEQKKSTTKKATAKKTTTKKTADKDSTKSTTKRTTKKKKEE